jgi:hypothetical protein
LLLKFLDKFFNRHNIPWVNLIWNTHYSNGELPQPENEKGSFWWKYLLKLCDTFKGIANCPIGNGTTVRFWLEVWNGNLLEHKFPRLFSFAKNKNILVAEFIRNNNFDQQFHLPLSVQAFQEYQTMQDIIQQTTISNEAKDVWNYLWGTPATLPQNFITFNTKMSSLQSPLYRYGTPAAPTKLESSIGSCSWIDSMLETFSKEKSTSLSGITITVFYVTSTVKKLLSIFFLLSLQSILLEYPQHP